MNEETAEPTHASGLMTYPGQSAWLKALWRSPIFLWRLGLKFTLPPQIMLLTTRGRKSGLPRRTMLEFTYMNGRVYVTSAWGRRSQWYQNILADPRVTVQTGRYGLIYGTAQRVTTDEELSRLYWQFRQSPVWDEYLAAYELGDRVDEFLTSKGRLIILHVEPGPVNSPPPQPADLAWVWLPLFALFAGYWLYLRMHDHPNDKSNL